MTEQPTTDHACAETKSRIVDALAASDLVSWDGSLITGGTEKIAEIVVAALKADAPKRVLQAEIDPTELTLRIAETCLGMKRPVDMDAKAALDQLHSSNPDIIGSFNRAAIKAAEYFVECINKTGNFAEMH